MRHYASRAFLFTGVIIAITSLSEAAFGQRPFPQPILNPANGHYYQLFTSNDWPRPLLFEDALSRAAAMSYLGIPGHLVTITSQAEQDFLTQRFRPGVHWIGASDAAVEGEWRWIAGPEAGQLFWLGNQTGTALGFHDWGRSYNDALIEPNNVLGGEDFASITIQGVGIRPYWNDANFYDRSDVAAIVEFSVVPEPSPAALFSSASFFLIMARRRALLACCQ